MKRLKIILLSSIAIILIAGMVVMACRPNYNQFKRFAEEAPGHRQKIVLRQVDSYLFSATFCKDYYYGSDYTGWELKQTVWYSGRFNNFYKIK